MTGRAAFARTPLGRRLPSGEPDDGRGRIRTARLRDGVSTLSSKFHIGETVNFYPSKEDFEAENAIDEYLMKGFAPAVPPLTPDTNIVAIGPCFAAMVGQPLLKQGYQVASRRDRHSYIGRFGDKIGNTFALRSQFEWAWLGKTPEVELWHGYEAERLAYDPGPRTRAKRLFDAADAFILTLGNAEIWEDKPTGGVFWGAVPADQFDAERHRFRVSTYQENLVNLMEVYRLIRRMRPNAAIVLTLAVPPAPATFRPVACLAASTAAKGMLRSCIDEFYRVVQPRDPNFHYFPSYDIARHAFDRPLTPDSRRLHPHVADFTALLFENYYGKPRLSAEDLFRSFRRALNADARLVGGAAVQPDPRQARRADRGRGLAEGGS